MADHQDDIGKIIEMAQRKRRQEADAAADKLSASLKSSCTAQLAFACLHMALSAAVVELIRQGGSEAVALLVHDTEIELRSVSRKTRFRKYPRGYDSGVEIEVINIGSLLGEVRSYLQVPQDADYVKIDEWVKILVAQQVGHITGQHQRVIPLG